MQVKETPDVSFPRVVESFPLEDVVVLADNAGVALGVQRAFSARVRSVRDDGSGLIASKCVEIPLVGCDGEISGVLCRTAPRSDTRGVFSSRGPERVRAIGDVAQFVVHDINNLLAVIGSGLRLLEFQSDAAYRKAMIIKMQHAITRGALLSRQLLDAARPFPNRSASSSQAAASQRWRTRWTRRCVLTSRSAPISTLICGTSTLTRRSCTSRC